MARLRTSMLPRQLTLQQLQRRFERLRQLQSGIRIPVPGYFEAFGTRYQLPLPVQQPRCLHLPQHTLEYLAGFFDGDGCVFANNSGCRLAVTQSIASSEVLLFFRNTLGGGIYATDGTQGLRRPKLQWCVHGHDAKQAAALLENIAVCKRHQLNILSLWRRKGTWRTQAVAQLSALKRAPPSVASCSSWAYFAGFFDAEGHIQMNPPGYLNLKVTQKFPQVLESLKAFLESRSISSNLYRRFDQCSYSLSISKSEDCRSILNALVLHGLRVKRDAARLALGMSRSNFLKVRLCLQQMVGNKGRYARLSQAGMARALQIKRQQDSLRAGRRGLRSSSADPRLLQLQADHAISCAEERLQMLRTDIRWLLRRRAAEAGTTGEEKQDADVQRSSARACRAPRPQLKEWRFSCACQFYP